MIKVHLDFGHGGSDPGAIGNGLKEKDLTLSIGLKVSKILTSHGIKVFHSRNTDKYISLTNRANASNKNGVDIFVSIHINSFTVATANGVETYSHIGSYNGAKVAKIVHDEIVKARLFMTNRGIKTANFTVLAKTKAPAILIELGFISNKQDAKVIKNKQNEIAVAVAKGILKYLGIRYKGASIPNVPSKPPISKPNPSPNQLKIDGYWGRATTMALQNQLGLKADGVISGQYQNNVTRSIPSVSFKTRTGSNVIKALQRKIGAKQDGYIGTGTVRALQRYLKTPVDGIISRPSTMVKTLQRKLNQGKF